MSAAANIPALLRPLLPGNAARGRVKAVGMRAVSRMLLFAYVLYLLKPVMPLMADKVAHTFWEHVHVAVVHQINGVDHVHYELRKAALDGEKDKGGVKHKTAVEDFDFAIVLAAGVMTPGPLPARLSRPVAYYRYSRYAVERPIELRPPKLV